MTELSDANTNKASLENEIQPDNTALTLNTIPNTAPEQSSGHEVDMQLDRVRVQLSKLPPTSTTIQTDRVDHEFATDTKIPSTPSEQYSLKEQIISVTTTLVSDKCRPYCHYQCHKPTRYQTPLWARSIIGSFNFQTNCSILLNRRLCDYRLCRLRRVAQGQGTHRDLLFVSVYWP
jgi:hypothetical protein